MSEHDHDVELQLVPEDVEHDDPDAEEIERLADLVRHWHQLDQQDGGPALAHEGNGMNPWGIRERIAATSGHPTPPPVSFGLDATGKFDLAPAEEHR